MCACVCDLKTTEVANDVLRREIVSPFPHTNGKQF